MSPIGPPPAHDATATPARRVLLVEDSASDAQLAAEHFALAGDDDEEPVVLAWVPRVAQAVERLAAEPFDAVLLDLSLPDAWELEGLAALSAAAPDVPVVVMTSRADDRLARAAVRAGAQDYLVKGRAGAGVVRRAVEYAMARQRLRRERETLLARERAAREAAERSSRARDDAVGVVSHDLRSPIAT